MSLVVMMHPMHHADPTGVYQPRRVGMMLECSPVELLARAAFVHHDDKGHNCFKFCKIILRFLGILNIVL